MPPLQLESIPCRQFARHSSNSAWFHSSRLGCVGFEDSLSRVIQTGGANEWHFWPKGMEITNSQSPFILWSSEEPISNFSWVVVSNAVFFNVHPIWGRFPFWPIFFKGVETTNYSFLFTNEFSRRRIHPGPISLKAHPIDSHESSKPHFCSDRKVI